MYCMHVVLCVNGSNVLISFKILLIIIVRSNQIVQIISFQVDVMVWKKIKILDGPTVIMVASCRLVLRNACVLGKT